MRGCRDAGRVGQDEAVSERPAEAPAPTIPDEARHEWSAVAERASAAQFAYHVKDAPTISVGEYDELIKTLQRLESAYPSLRTPDSPTQSVGGAIFSIHKGFGAAAGKLIGAIALAAIALGAVGLTVSFENTVNRHGNNVLTGQYGQ